MKKLLTLFFFVCLMAVSSFLHAQTVQIGSGTTTTNYFPIYSCYGYNYSQQIYLGSEIVAGGGGAGTITHIRFYYSSGGTTLANWADWTVYIGNSTRTTFASSTDWEPVGNLTQVFSGNIPTPVAGTWVELELSTPFNYTGDNIIVAVDENSPGYSCTAAWRSFASGSNRGILYYSDGTNPDPANPPTANYGPNATLAQIQFFFLEPPCSGTPTPGNTLTSAEPVCSGVNFTLSLENATPGSGVTYQWQSSPDGNAPWTDLGTAPTQVISQTADTYYRCEVTCDGNTGTSTAVYVTMDNFVNCYCASNATSTADTKIDNVTLNTLNQSSAPGTCETYTDYTAMATITELQRGVAYPMSVTQGSCGGAYGSWIKVYIDFNQDGQFDEVTEMVFSAASAGLGTATLQNISVPVGATLGETRMRVVLREGGNATTTLACGTYFYGETEDYLVEITEAPPCLPPTGLTATNITSTTADLSWTAGGGETQWEFAYGVSPFGTPTSGTMLSSNSINLTGLSPATAYQYYVRSFCDPDYSDWAGPFNFSTLLCDPVDQCTYTVTLADSYGDGWDGTVLGFRQNGQIVATFGQGFTSGSSFGPVNIDLCDGILTEIVVVTVGSWVGEKGFTVYDPFSNEVFNWPFYGTFDASTVFHTFTTSCTPPSCPNPSNLSSSNPTANGADLAWDHPVPDSFFDIFIDISGVPAPDAMTTPTVTNFQGQNYTWTGGQSSTAYDWYVRTNCGTETSDWVGPNTFVTLCDVYATPFMEDAEVLPIPCWSVFSSTTYNWGVSSSASAYGIGTNSFIANFYSINDPTPFYLITPEFDMTTLTSPALKFDFAHAAYSAIYTDEMNILYSTDGGSSFSLLRNMPGGVDGVLNTGGTVSGSFFPTAQEWKSIQIELPAGTNMIAFEAVSDWGNNLFIDNIEINDCTPFTPVFDQLGPYCQGDIANVLPTTSIDGVPGIWDGVLSTDNPGSFLFTFTPDPGQCALTATMTVEVNPTYFSSETVNVWDYTLPYSWEGDLYWAGGTYTVTYPTILGCDSVKELVLNVDPSGTLWVNKQMGTAAQANWSPIAGIDRYQVRYWDNDGGGIFVTVVQTTNIWRKLVNLTPNTNYEVEIGYRTCPNCPYVWGYYPNALFNSGDVNFTFTQDIGTKMLAQWDALDDVTSYILQYRLSGGSWTVKGIFNTPEAVMGGINENTDYEFRVIPRYDNIGFWQSDPKSHTSNLVTYNVVYTGGETADFSWDWTDVLTPPESGYILQVREVGATLWTSYPTATNARFVGDLTTGLSYEYRLVVQFNGNTWGATSIQPLGPGSKESVIESVSNLNVYPNPVNDLLTVEILSEQTGTHIWNLYDVNGKIVMSGENHLTQGANYFVIETAHLSNGLYLLQSNVNGVLQTSRIIKQ